MLVKFWETVGTKLGERWVASAVGPALAFWAVGALLWLRERAANADRVVSWFDGEPVGVQALSLGAAAMVLTASAVIVRWLVLPVLRLLEGYWPDWGPVRWLREKLVERRWQEACAVASEWQSLDAERDGWEAERDARTGDEGAADAWRARSRQRARHALLDAQRRRAPARFGDFRPTRVGNVLAAGETRPVDKYGLDPIVCWSALWLVLSESSRAALAESRQSLDAIVGLMMWSGLLAVWSVFTPWAAAAAVVLVAGLYLGTLRAAEGYADLIEAAFDVHRVALYQALRFEPPESPEREPEQGRALTKHLLRGGGTGRYTSAAEAPAGAPAPPAAATGSSSAPGAGRSG